MSDQLSDAYLEISRLEKKITFAGQQLLGFENEKRGVVLDARKLELRDKPEHEAFKLRYHHAVEDVRTAEKAAESAAKAHKSAKESQELALEALTQLEQQTDEQRAAEEEEQLPLVKQAHNAGGNTNEQWRSLPLDSLRLTAAVLEKLASPVNKKSDKTLGEVTTLGGLVDLVNAGTSYSQLKGISSTTSGKIEEAWMEFWERHPEYCQNPVGTIPPGIAEEPQLGILSVPDEEPASHPIADLSKHGLKVAVLNSLQAGGHNTVESVNEISDDDDLLVDVVGKKAVRNVRLAVESWRAMQ